MFTTAAPTDQRAGAKPIAFTLQTPTTISSPVTLKIRPEDLNRTENQRVQANQTIGRGVNGWVDHYGEGLPTLNISGHTGWRTGGGSGEDGAQAFNTLNTLIMKSYPQAIQDAIDAGRDPQQVKLIFVDMLDDFSWVVVPQQFVLRRSKSRPLLFQYTMQFQCVATDLENPLMILPFGGSVASGMKALNGVITSIEESGKTIEGWIQKAVAFKDQLLAPVAQAVRLFNESANRIFNTVNGVISAGKNAINGTANSLINIAHDVAKVGMNIHRTIAAITGIPQDVQHAIQRVAGAFSEAYCIFNNSLKTKRIYENYDGLFGASNCSSTTGGNQPSSYANMNAFALLNDREQPVTLTADARAAISELGNADPVLRPTPVAEMNRLVTTAVNGTKING